MIYWLNHGPANYAGQPFLTGILLFGMLVNVILTPKQGHVGLANIIRPKNDPTAFIIMFAGPTAGERIRGFKTVTIGHL